MPCIFVCFAFYTVQCAYFNIVVLNDMHLDNGMLQLKPHDIYISYVCIVLSTALGNALGNATLKLQMI